MNSESELRDVGLDADLLRMRCHGPGDPPRTIGDGRGVIRGMCSIPGEEVTELGENSKELECERKLALGRIGAVPVVPWPGENGIAPGTRSSDALVGVKGDSG